VSDLIIVIVVVYCNFAQRWEPISQNCPFHRKQVCQIITDIMKGLPCVVVHVGGVRNPNLPSDVDALLISKRDWLNQKVGQVKTHIANQ